MFTESAWLTDLTVVYSDGMEQYVPYWEGDTYNSQMFFKNGETLEILYNTDYSEDIYNGLYFGEVREPKKTYHSKATSKWVEVFMLENEWLILNKWSQFVKRVE